jgi:hypothetical protein
VEEALSSPTFSSGNGYTLITQGYRGNECDSNQGCSEYDTGVASSQTVPMSLGSSAPFVESAIAFSTMSNPQSGLLVNGYPPLAIPAGIAVVFQVTFTDSDPSGRAVTLWPDSDMVIGSVDCSGYGYGYGGCGGWWAGPWEYENFYIIDGFNQQVTGVDGYTSTTGNFITLQPNVPTTLWFGASAPYGTGTVSIWTPEYGPGNQYGYPDYTPFNAFFSLEGTFSDGTLFGQTIPYPFAQITQANAAISPEAGSTGATISVTCSGQYCGFNSDNKGFVGWINSEGQVTVLTTFTTTANGNIPSGVTFTVPSATAGYYTIVVSDYINSVFSTFQHT